MGVGAAIAAGSHGENGKIALLVIKAHKRIQTKLASESCQNTKEKVPIDVTPINITETIINASPIRFIKRVKIPEKIDTED